MNCWAWLVLAGAPVLADWPQSPYESTGYEAVSADVLHTPNLPQTPYSWQPPVATPYGATPYGAMPPQVARVSVPGGEIPPVPVAPPAALPAPPSPGYRPVGSGAMFSANDPVPPVPNPRPAATPAWPSVDSRYSSLLADTADQSAGCLEPGGGCFESMTGCGPPAGFWNGWTLDAGARAYYIDDQRIQWTGNEKTFAVEGFLAPCFAKDYGTWEAALDSEIYLNQPFDGNMLLDSAERQSYAGNFDIPVVEISKLCITATRGDLSVSLGKFLTPFGRTYFPLLTNAWIDAPFVRTEAILWRETGFLASYTPGLLSIDMALVNGTEDQDTNSSKAAIGRIGMDAESFAVGCSAKMHDGVGSEIQKQYKNHIGFDAMVRWSRFTLSGEAVYDEYGYHRPGFDPLGTTWYRSIYYRDQVKGTKDPIKGTGYYVDLLCDFEPLLLSCNFGQYFPEELGIPQHDVTQTRGILKAVYSLNPSIHLYGVGILENGGYIAQADRQRRGWCCFMGMMWTL